MTKTKPTKSPAYDSRLAEKLVALLRYEIAPSTQGVGPFEILGELLDLTREEVLNHTFGDDEDADYTREQMCELERWSAIVAEHLIRALAMCGLADKAEAFLEDHARSRRECAAKFNQAPEVPFTDEERKALADAWGKEQAVAS
ncbi:MAG: hypothetical protein AB7O24_33550 [Kofleriaceae bacterium]